MHGSRGGSGGPDSPPPPPTPLVFWQKYGYPIREWGWFDIAQHLCLTLSQTSPGFYVSAIQVI